MSQQVEELAHNYYSKDALDHPILQPLADLLKRELGVLRAACKVKDARNAAAVQYEGIVLSLLDFRDAITAWQGENRGEVCPIDSRCAQRLLVLPQVPTFEDHSSIAETAL